jgi:hypothetical protein
MEGTLSSGISPWQRVRGIVKTEIPALTLKKKIPIEAGGYIPGIFFSKDHFVPVFYVG